MSTAGDGSTCAHHLRHMQPGMGHWPGMFLGVEYSRMLIGRGDPSLAWVEK